MPTYRLGDLDITNPLKPGTPLVLPDTAALDSFSITTAPSLAEMSATGTRLDLAPLRPGSAPSFTFQGHLQPAGVVRVALDAAVDRDAAIARGRELRVRGPIARFRRRGDCGAPDAHDAARAYAQAPEQEATLGRSPHTSSSHRRPHDEVRLLGVYQLAQHPNDAWIPLDAATNFHDVLTLVQGAWERTNPDHLAWRVAGGVRHAFLDPWRPPSSPSRSIQ